MKRWNILLILTILPGIGFPGEVWAHASKIRYRQTQAIQIQALSEDNKPMTNAQVVVYAPDKLSKPWSTGTTDKSGYFTFIPDLSQPGNWQVKVSHAGHGDKINIAVAPPLTPSSSPQKAGDEVQSGTRSQPQSPQPENDTSSPQATWASSKQQEYSPLQTGLMAVSGVWGFIGTALFFFRRKAKQL